MFMPNPKKIKRQHDGPNSSFNNEEYNNDIGGVDYDVDRSYCVYPREKVTKRSRHYQKIQEYEQGHCDIYQKKNDGMDDYCTDDFVNVTDATFSSRRKVKTTKKKGGVGYPVLRNNNTVPSNNNTKCLRDADFSVNVYFGDTASSYGTTKKFLTKIESIKCLKMSAFAGLDEAVEYCLSKNKARKNFKSQTMNTSSSSSSGMQYEENVIESIDVDINDLFINKNLVVLMEFPFHSIIDTRIEIICLVARAINDIHTGVVVEGKSLNDLTIPNIIIPVSLDIRIVKECLFDMYGFDKHIKKYEYPLPQPNPETPNHHHHNYIKNDYGNNKNSGGGKFNIVLYQKQRQGICKLEILLDRKSFLSNRVGIWPWIVDNIDDTNLKVSYDNDITTIHMKIPTSGNIYVSAAVCRSIGSSTGIIQDEIPPTFLREMKLGETISECRRWGIDDRRSSMIVCSEHYKMLVKDVEDMISNMQSRGTILQREGYIDLSRHIKGFQCTSYDIKRTMSHIILSLISECLHKNNQRLPFIIRIGLVNVKMRNTNQQQQQNPFTTNEDKYMIEENIKPSVIRNELLYGFDMYAYQANIYNYKISSITHSDDIYEDCYTEKIDTEDYIQQTDMEIDTFDYTKFEYMNSSPIVITTGLVDNSTGYVDIKFEPIIVEAEEIMCTDYEEQNQYTRHNNAENTYDVENEEIHYHYYQQDDIENSNNNNNNNNNQAIKNIGTHNDIVAGSFLSSYVESRSSLLFESLQHQQDCVSKKPESIRVANIVDIINGALHSIISKTGHTNFEDMISVPHTPEEKNGYDYYTNREDLLRRIAFPHTPVIESREIVHESTGMKDLEAIYYADLVVNTRNDEMCELLDLNYDKPEHPLNEGLKTIWSTIINEVSDQMSTFAPYIYDDIVLINQKVLYKNNARPELLITLPVSEFYRVWNESIAEKKVNSQSVIQRYRTVLSKYYECTHSDNTNTNDVIPNTILYGMETDFWGWVESNYHMFNFDPMDVCLQVLRDSNITISKRCIGIVSFLINRILNQMGYTLKDIKLAPCNPIDLGEGIIKDCFSSLSYPVKIESMLLKKINYCIKN